MSDKKDSSIFVEKIKKSLNCNYSIPRLHEMTENLTALDEMMKIYAYHNEWQNEYKEYEELHQKYGEFRMKYY